ncbi:hypothetical protein CSA37_05900 [Candidatus Fermentibacteria bacterium]|nr:MAG: hypothetical protein CSA37_05900 [Candidatus Fermentibacteria bacterium]
MPVFLSVLTVIVSAELTDPRYPAVNHDGSQIVFCWRGALWSTGTEGGIPRCLTPGDCENRYPEFSSDGEWIAFTGYGTGGGDVYVMPDEDGGGSTHDLILSSLSRESYAMSMDRSGEVSLEPLGVYREPLVLLINEQCYSDAEVFPAAWKELELGPVVGNTTYGAVIGTVDVQLFDGTGFRLPETGWYTLNGNNLENSGVTPDITVVEMPLDADRGLDRQLERAVESALEQIER